MGLKGKLIAEIEVKSSGHHVRDHFFTKPHNLPNVCPSIFQTFQIHEGELGMPGSIYFWNYTIGAKACSAKTSIESVDEVNKIIRFKLTEGDPLIDYKMFMFQIHTMDNEVKWTAEYEKRREDGPHPIDYINLALDIVENIDNHHHKP